MHSCLRDTFVFAGCAVLIAIGERGCFPQVEASAVASVLSSLPSPAVPSSASFSAPAAKTEIGIFAENYFTQRSSGHFVSGYSISQTMLPGYGGAVEFRRWIGKNDAGSLLFSGTPSASRLYLPNKTSSAWPVKRYEFDLLWSHSLKSNGGMPWSFIEAGAGAIALDGGNDASGGSGWDRQWPIVVGIGMQCRASRNLSFRFEALIDIMKASTFSDQTYQSSWTFATRPIAGIVLRPIW